MLLCGSFKGYCEEPFIRKTANFETTLRCNLSCRMCTQAPVKNILPDMEFKKFRELNELHRFTHVSFVGGEPFLNRDFFKMMRFCDAKKITYEITTNGTLLNDGIIKKLKCLAGLKKLNFSLDGDKKTHERIRGRGTFKKCKASIKGSLACFDVAVNSVLQKENARSLPRVTSMLSKWGVKEHKIISAVSFSSGAVDEARRTSGDLVLAGPVFEEAVRIEREELKRFLTIIKGVIKRCPIKVSREPSSCAARSNKIDGPLNCRQLHHYRFDPSSKRIICEFFRNVYDDAMVKRIEKSNLSVCSVCCKKD